MSTEDLPLSLLENLEQYLKAQASDEEDLESRQKFREEDVGLTNS